MTPSVQNESSPASASLRAPGTTAHSLREWEAAQPLSGNWWLARHCPGKALCWAVGCVGACPAGRLGSPSCRTHAGCAKQRQHPKVSEGALGGL